MSGRTAWRRHMRRYGLSMAAYVAVLVPVVLLAGSDHLPPAPWSYLMAVLPALPIFGAIWALLRYYEEEEDEYLRTVAIRLYIIATGLTFALCTAWGFLQALAGMPKISLFWIFIINCGFQGLATACQFWSWRGQFRG